MNKLLLTLSVCALTGSLAANPNITDCKKQINQVNSYLKNNTCNIQSLSDAQEKLFQLNNCLDVKSLLAKIESQKTDSSKVKVVKECKDNAVKKVSKKVKLKSKIQKTTKPVTTKPETTKPETTKPVTTKPETTKPETTVPGSSKNDYSEFRAQVIEIVNKERATYGLASLAENTEVTKIATMKSQDMADLNYFDHTSPIYGSPFDMLTKFGVKYTAAGENIAMGQSTPQEVMTAWMNSDGHRKNILNSNYTHIGVGIVKNQKGQYIWTQMFTR